MNNMFQRLIVGLVLTTYCLGCTPPPREDPPFPKLYRSSASHHRTGAPVTDSQKAKPDKEAPVPRSEAPSLEEIERAIRVFQAQRRTSGPSMDTAWEPFLKAALAYLNQPAEYLHFSPLIRARVAAEFELDRDQHRKEGASPELEQAVTVVLSRIDYQVQKLRALSGKVRPKLSLAMSGKSGRLSWPLSCGLITSGFGQRKDPINPKRTQFHNGVDLAAPPHEPVYAAASGKVVFAGWGGGAGQMVRIRHSKNQETLYGHLAAILVQLDQEVSRGQIVGLLGRTGRSTGHHLHFAVYIDNQAVNPMEHLMSVPMGFSDLTPGIVFGNDE